jgi:hypothetical protein
VFSLPVGIGTIADDDTSDTTPPESAVLPLDPMRCSPTFVVSVLAVDEFAESTAANSGIASVDVFVSANGGPFELWTTLTDGRTTARFTPQSNSSYEFYTVARDLAGNVEPGPYFPSAATTVASLALLGDANCDGIVNHGDAAALGRNFGRSVNVAWKDGDFDGDGQVGLRDLAIVQANLTGERPGDANRDGLVDRRDLAIVARNLGHLVDAVWSDGDFNGDGHVNLKDLVVLQEHLVSAIEPTPSPAAATSASAASHAGPLSRASDRRAILTANRRPTPLALDRFFGGPAHNCQQVALWRALPSDCVSKIRATRQQRLDIRLSSDWTPHPLALTARR